MLQLCLHPGNIIPDTHHLKEERFILSHNFRSFSPWLVGLNVEIARWEGLPWKKAARVMAAREQRAETDLSKSHP